MFLTFVSHHETGDIESALSGRVVRSPICWRPTLYPGCKMRDMTHFDIFCSFNRGTLQTWENINCQQKILTQHETSRMTVHFMSVFLVLFGWNLWHPSQQQKKGWPCFMAKMSRRLQRSPRPSLWRRMPLGALKVVEDSQPGFWRLEKDRKTHVFGSNLNVSRRFDLLTT